MTVARQVLIVHLPWTHTMQAYTEQARAEWLQWAVLEKGYRDTSTLPAPPAATDPAPAAGAWQGQVAPGAQARLGPVAHAPAAAAAAAAAAVAPAPAPAPAGATSLWAQSLVASSEAQASGWVVGG